MTVRDHMTLTLAATPYRHQGSRETDALDHLGMTPTRYYARLNWLLDQPDAAAEHPMTVARLRRLRDRRRAARLG